MSGLILELQADALNSKVQVTDLLRKAKAVSKKLRASEIEEWIEHELSGYQHLADVPDYRRVQGDLKCFNPVRGWMPLAVRDPKIAEAISTSPIVEPVSELEALTANKSGTLMRTFSPAQEKSLMDAMEYPFRPGLELSPSSLVAVVDAVRNRVLTWALDLEARGVLGEGMTFSNAEREAAHQVSTSYHYTTNIGSMTGSQLQQHSSGAHQYQATTTGVDAATLVALVEAITANVDQLRLPADARAELLAELETLRAQAASPNPKTGIVREMLESVRRILEGAAGNVLAATYGPQVAELLSQLAS